MIAATFNMHDHPTTYYLGRATHTWLRRCMCRSESESASGFVRQNKEPANMTHTKLALVERVLGAKRAHAKSQSVTMMEQVGSGVRAHVGRGAAGVRTHVQAWDGAHPLASRSRPVHA